MYVLPKNVAVLFLDPALRRARRTGTMDAHTEFLAASSSQAMAPARTQSLWS